MARRPDVHYIQYYTDGSAAYQLESVRQPMKPQPVRKPAKRKRLTLYIDPLAIAGILVAAIMLTLMLVGVSRLKHAQEQTDAMAKQVEQLQEKNQTLRTDYDAVCDLEDIRWKAEALGLVPVEQVQHILLPSPEAEPAEAPSVWEKFCTYLTSLFA